MSAPPVCLRDRDYSRNKSTEKIKTDISTKSQTQETVSKPLWYVAEGQYVRKTRVCSVSEPIELGTEVKLEHQLHLQHKSRLNKVPCVSL